MDIYLCLLTLYMMNHEYKSASKPYTWINTNIYLLINTFRAETRDFLNSLRARTRVCKWGPYHSCWCPAPPPLRRQAISSHFLGFTGLTSPCPPWGKIWITSFQWRHNERHGVSNHRRLDCLFSTVCSGGDQRKHQSSVSFDFVW